MVEMLGFSMEYLERVGQAVKKAQAAKLLVVHVCMAFRPGAPEMSPSNRMLYPFSKNGLLTLGSPGSATHSSIPVEPTDVTVTRARTSAFQDSDLDAVLRSQGVQHLVLAGNATRMGVLATFFDAADRDYGLTVLSDCCADTNPATHDFLMKDVYPLQARVVTLAEWTAE